MRDRGFLQRPFCKPGLEMQLDMKSCHRKYKEVKNESFRATLKKAD